MWFALDAFIPLVEISKNSSIKIDLDLLFLQQGYRVTKVCSKIDLMNQKWCVLCQTRLIKQVYQPFCSERCRNQDLGNWLTGLYHIAEDRIDSDNNDRQDKS